MHASGPDVGGAPVTRRPHTIVAAALLALLAPTAVMARASADVGRDHYLARAERGQTSLAVGPPSTLVADNFTVLGHSNLVGGSPHGDIHFFDYGGVTGKYVFVGSWSSPCSGEGVKVVDVNNPAQPKVVAVAGGRSGTSSEDVSVIRVGDRVVLGVGVQTCKAQAGAGSLDLFDVTNPSRPRLLSSLAEPNGVHELDLVARADGRALALLAVPFNEFVDVYFGTDLGGEFRIVDITDPTAPFETADWGVIADSTLRDFAGGYEVDSSFQGLGYYAAYYAHSARAADGGMSAYVSYWDAGVLKLDISDPADPRLVGRTQYAIDEEGDAHSLATYDVGGKRYVLQNSEEGEALSPVLVTSSATGTTQYHGIDEPWAPRLLTTLPGRTLTSTVHDANDGCQAGDYAGAAGKVALADTVDPFYVGIIDGWTAPCTIGTQVRLAGQAGATALLSNLVSPDDAWPFAQGVTSRVLSAAAGLVVVQVSDIDGMADTLRAAGGTQSVTMTAGAPEWGFLEVFDESQAADVNGDGTPEFRQVGEFSDGPPVTGVFPAPAGTWTIHNTEVNGDRGYAAWFANGVVAMDLSDPANPRFAGQFVPPTNARFASSLGAGPASVWGVAVDPATGIVYASDMRTGLWVVRPTGSAAP